jgi:hypothetical protein
VAELPVAVDGPTLSESAWQQVVLMVTEQQVHVGALLNHARPAQCDAGIATLLVPDAFHARVLREASDPIRSALLQVTGETWKEVRFREDASVAPPSDKPEDFDPTAALAALCEEYPAIRHLVERFGGEIVW